MKVQSSEAWQGRSVPRRIQELFQSFAIQVLGNCSLAWGAGEGREVRKDLRGLFLA